MGLAFAMISGTMDVLRCICCSVKVVEARRAVPLPINGKANVKAAVEKRWE